MAGCLIGTTEMTVTAIELDTLTRGGIGADIAHGRASLWILPGANRSTLAKLAGLYWANAWNFDDSLDFAAMCRAANPSREPWLVSDAEADPEALQSASFIRIYQLGSSNTEKASQGLRKIKAEQLKLRASHFGGSLFIFGDVERHEDEVSLICEIAPQLKICVLSDAKISIATTKEIFQWSDSLTHFIDVFSQSAASVASAEVLDLKDAPGIKLPQTLIDELGGDWTLLTRKETAPSAISQGLFDQFLSGEATWPVYAAGGAYVRFVWKPAPDNTDKQAIDFKEELIQIIRGLDETEVDPRDALRQRIIFAEPGSGVTTLLRQLAVLSAQAGYPTLLSKPQPRNLMARSLGRTIGAIQDLWWQHRRGKGGGKGRIPVVVFIDKDAESASDTKMLAKSLSTVGREIVLVRVLERSRDEMNAARGVYLLPSEISEAELLALGAHLRKFAERHSLSPLPGDAEWRAYHEGLNQVARYSPGGSTDVEEVPHLFLIGIYPFVSERVADVNSLEQYYFQRWDRIQSQNVRSLIHTVAAAGVFNLSVPYNALRRHKDLDISELETPSSEVHRTIDAFVEWRALGTNLAGWYLRIRHPLVGRLLCRAIDPVEGEVPFRPMLGILSQLTTKSDDLWFAENLVVRTGQNFRTSSPAFSLESDTPVQKAARAIFDAIPAALKEASRPISHHEARYHIHIIHACLAALERPQSTTLPPNQIRAVLDEEVALSSEWLDRALRIHASLEPEGNIYNTYARLKFAYAAAFRGTDPERFQETFQDGLNLQELAIECDATNGYALYQFVQQIVEAAPVSGSSWSSEKQLELLSRAEARLTDLMRLQQENRWRNIDPIEAEVQLGTLLAKHYETIAKLPNLQHLMDQFRIKNPEAAIRILVRLYVGKDAFEKVFRSGSAEKLRQYRQELFELPSKTPRGLLYLYRLFISDPQGRLKFKDRLDVLTELKRKSPQQFLPYWHDEASLLCQLDNLPAGAQRFAELRAYRQAQEAQWFWLNERVLLAHNGSVRPRVMTLSVINPEEGWARFKNTNVRLRYQPQQFQPLSRNEPFRAYVRFTIYGLQAVPEQLAQQDFKALELS